MSKRFIAATTLLLATSLAGAQQATAPAETGAAVAPPLIIDSDTNEHDLRSGVTRFNDNVTITRGAMKVFADQGVVRQAEGRITEVVLTGSPTTWQDTLDDGTAVEGEAERIHFDVVDNVVTLTGNARLQHEQGEYTGDELVYDLDTESLAGRGTNGNRVRVVIEPDAVERDAEKADAGGKSDQEEEPPAEPPDQP